MSPPTEPFAGETVERPDPGLARGRWEAPAWSFYVVLVVTILGALAWAVIARTRRDRHGRAERR